MNTIDICTKVAELSSEFELCSNDIKRRYIIKNIMMYNYVTSMIKYNLGTFGTGYPFYALNEDLTGNLPIIEEQLRYNQELIEYVLNSMRTIWPCANCLIQNDSKMKDLKQICKPCPKINNELKPRKVINRLPDIDMWLITKDDSINETSKELSQLFLENELFTSDINPLKTFLDFEVIVKDLQNNKMPSKYLPIDAHIIGYDDLFKLIQEVPEALKEAKETNHAPFVPIHPLSYRKTWQYDDTSYNLVHDFLSSLTPYNFEGKLYDVLVDTRKQIADTYTIEELYDFLISSGPDSVLRRHRTKELKTRFEERVNSWKR